MELVWGANTRLLRLPKCSRLIGNSFEVLECSCALPLTHKTFTKPKRWEERDIYDDGCLCERKAVHNLGGGSSVPVAALMGYASVWGGIGEPFRKTVSNHF